MAARRAVLAVSSMLVALALCRGNAEASPARRVDFPCKGCLFDPPKEGAAPSPLLVVLHGDTPSGKAPLVERDASPWRKAAESRGIALLAPMCPKAEGCRVGSYWQWTEGDPVAWIRAQVALVEKEYAIDPKRVWIAGWSGGASFLGYRYAELSSTFAAVVFAGGGMPMATARCPSCKVPGYFLVGDRNPLHHLAKGLRAEVETCTSEVVWDLEKGKDHAGEWRALGATGKTAEILDWLAKHPQSCNAETTEAKEPADAGQDAEARPAAEAEKRSDQAMPDAAAEPIALPPRSHCGCRWVGGEEGATERFGVAVLGFLLFRQASKRIKRERLPKRRR